MLFRSGHGVGVGGGWVIRHLGSFSRVSALGRRGPPAQSRTAFSTRASTPRLIHAEADDTSQRGDVRIVGCNACKTTPWRSVGLTRIRTLCRGAGFLYLLRRGRIRWRWCESQSLPRSVQLLEHRLGSVRVPSVSCNPRCGAVRTRQYWTGRRPWPPRPPHSTPAAMSTAVAATVIQPAR